MANSSKPRSRRRGGQSSREMPLPGGPGPALPTAVGADANNRPGRLRSFRRKAADAARGEVLRLVSEGYSNKEGAKRMNISYRTFECHARR